MALERTPDRQKLKSRWWPGRAKACMCALRTFVAPCFESWLFASFCGEICVVVAARARKINSFGLNDLNTRFYDSFRRGKAVSFYDFSLVFGDLVVMVPTDNGQFLPTYRFLLGGSLNEKRSLIGTAFIQDFLPVGRGNELQPQQGGVRILCRIENALGFIQTDR